MKSKLLALSPLADIAIVVGFLAMCAFAFTAYSSGGSGNDDPVFSYATSTTKSVGKDLATTVLPASSGRSYVEISNVSSNTIFCSVGGTPALNSGVTIFASSTRTWGREDSVPVGAIKCLADTATSSVAVVAK